MVNGEMKKMASGKSKKDLKASKKASRLLAKKTKTANKAIKQLKKEKKYEYKVSGDVLKMASGKSKKDLKASKQASKLLTKKTKTAKKALKQLNKEKKSTESMINYCKSMGVYFANQAALEGDSPCETSDMFLTGFLASEEYAEALTAYRSKFTEENINSGEGNLEDLTE